ncbi:hypothetical protein LR48_Vigan04g125200 [Vigna angularis]|uniref:Uncharacterized protein n=1 Tax=Phaseolus angularis TaxID=3914 RepID=A0A0L9UEU0_PHAAN|nr:hypothetical protein LR48_Vigan04g125200 [Vigna angularis]
MMYGLHEYRKVSYNSGSGIFPEAVLLKNEGMSSCCLKLLFDKIHTRSKKNSEPLLEGLDESRRRVRIRTSRELFPSPETLLQPSPQGSDQSTEKMAGENNGRRTLADYTTVVGPYHFNSIARPRVKNTA